MMNADIVVLGGSAAGITAAVTARRHYPDKRILLVRQERQVPIPCGIPYIFGTLGSPQNNLIADTILESHRVDLLIAEAVRLDPDRRQVHTGDQPLQYKRLVLATGSLPVCPPIPGASLSGVFFINKDVQYLARLRKAIDDAEHVVIVGGGFIGIEFADEVNKLDGKRVTVLELADHCLSLSYDVEFCVEVEQKLRDRGIGVRTEVRVTSLTGDGEVEAARLADGSDVPADLVIFGLGARANIKLAQEAGLTIGPTGGIAVDRAMQTSDPAIFACGDCAEKISFFGGRPSSLKLASIAQLEARIAGANVFDLRRESEGTVGVWSTAVGELAMGTAGLTEAMAKARGYQIECVTVEGPDRHPASMPGVVMVKVKLVFGRHSLVLLGGQVRGGDSVGETINTIAALVQKRMTAEDIAMFQVGTHPALTPSPIVHPLVNAAELAIQAVREGKPSDPSERKQIPDTAVAR